VRLLSPQHWAQEVNDHYPNDNGEWCATYNDGVGIFWNQQKFKKTINIDPDKSNVAIMWTVDGINNSSKMTKRISKLAMDVTVQQYDQQEIENTMDDDDIPYEDSVTWDKIEGVANDENNHVQIHSEEVNNTNKNHSDKLLDWHICLGHLSMKELQALAAGGTLPKTLLKCKIPICAEFLYGKLT
jgi:hypothetical protein